GFRSCSRRGAGGRAPVAPADRVAFELDLLDPDVLQRLQRAARVPAGQPRLPDALAERLAQQRSLACVGSLLEGLRPELQVITLVSLSLRGDGLDPAWGIDGWLARLAHARRQTVLSLETPEQQVALLVAPRPAEVATVVRRGLDELEDPATRRVALRLAEHWAASDLAAIENFAQWCGCLESEAERQAHQAGVLARNPAMAERIATMHQRGARVFAAVGALHMTGPEGLPALLARRGFQVELLLPKAGRH
ncbi:TraB/GumN family protein, partial [Sphaerotilus sulfidivorans]